MKRTLNKIKTSLATLLIALVSFSSKIFAQRWEYPEAAIGQTLYWVYNPKPLPETIIRISQRLLVAVVLILWIVNFIRIRKIEDKSEKNKKIKKAVIVIAILLVILIATFVISTLLLGR